VIGELVATWNVDVQVRVGLTLAAVGAVIWAIRRRRP
jgi:hypothetical protein